MNYSSVCPNPLIGLILIILSSFFFSLVILSSSAHFPIPIMSLPTPHTPLHYSHHSATPLTFFFCLCCRDSHSIVSITCYWSHTVCIRYYVIIMYFSLNSLRECSLLYVYCRREMMKQRDIALTDAVRATARWRFGSFLEGSKCHIRLGGMGLW